LDGYIILIGSVARNDFSKNSDIDICRINSKNEISRRPGWPNGPINYVDYDIDVFEHLFNIGSLFIYHILHEGNLIDGNQYIWKNYKANFTTKTDYSEELASLRSLNHIFDNIELFGNKYLTLFSNFFTIIKNFSIFYLASKNQFFFNKEKAIKTVFGNYYYEMLSDSYNYFERGIISSKWDYNCKSSAEQIIKYYLSKMEVIGNAK
jgi:hypothetical protein